MDIILYKDINKKQTCFLIYMIAVLQKKSKYEMHHKGKETEKLTQTCLLSIIHVCIFPSLPTNKQSNNQRKMSASIQRNQCNKKTKDFV